MIHKSTQHIVNLLISHNWNGNLRIDKVIIDVIITNFDVDEIDDLVDKYSDTNTQYFKRLIQSIIRINENNNFQKIILEERYDGYYIEQKLKDILVSKKYKDVIKFIESFDSPSVKNKGILYENFCRVFLNDLGINSKLTPVSNDKGIDILGSFNTNLPDEIGKLVFNEEIYLLVQTKYFKTKIDTPVIRKLVGDSLFIRFDELEYAEIKHNAFHLIVFSHNGFTQPAIKFGKKNKIKLFDSVKIAHIIAEKPNKIWNCLTVT